MINLETLRLKVVPLTLKQFAGLLQSTEIMESLLGLNPSGASPDKDTQEAMEALYRSALNHPDNYLWYTNWQIILKAENKSIGSACFMKEPDENGQIEVGYGINKTYRNQGYMTDALQAICEWVFSREEIKCIIAETEENNVGSHSVLQKCGMTIYSKKDNIFSWRLNK